MYLIHTWLSQHDFYPDVFIFDGLLVRHDHRLTEYLPLCEAYIRETTGFTVRLVQKAMNKVLDTQEVEIEDADDALEPLQVTTDAQGLIRGDQGYCCQQTYRALQEQYDQANKEGKESAAELLLTYLAQFVMRDLKTATYLLRDTIRATFTPFCTRAQVEMQFSKKELAQWEHMGLQKVKETRFELSDIRFGDKQPNGTYAFYNRFNGFRAKKIERHIEDHEVAIWTNHLLTVVCDGDIKLYWYFVEWFKAVVTRGNPKVVPVLFGDQGVGKGILFTQFAKCIIGEEYYLETNDMLQLINGSFNAQLVDKFFVLIDETAVVKSDFHSAFDKFKNWVTSDYFTVKKKYVNEFTVPNTLTFAIASNHYKSIKMEAGCRRLSSCAVKPTYCTLGSCKSRPL